MIKEAFRTAGAKKEGESRIDILDAILAERGDLQGQGAYFPGQGQKAHTIIIGEEVFKGPKYASGEHLDDFNTECKYLKLLEGSGLPIPKITTIGKDFLFFGMTKTPGIEMPSVFSPDLTKGEKEALAKDLINFVIEMAHALPMQDGKFAMHDDLWNANIIIDPVTKRLAGVIDFGKVAYKTADEWKPMFDFDGSDFSDMMKAEFNRRKSELPGYKEQKLKAGPGERFMKFLRGELST